MQETHRSFPGWKESLCVLAGLAAVLLPMERRWPYYFLQDDNRDYFLPYLVHNWRSLVEGQFPLYNFHQYSGIPGGGLSESFFVPAYLATFLSQVWFRHPFAAVDFLAIGHLAVGALGWLALFRLLGVSPAAAAFGALAEALNGFQIYGGASWIFVTVAGACFPWMLFFGLAFLQGPSAGKMLGLIAAHLWLFYAGYPQYFLYASGFEVLLLAGLTFRGAVRLPRTGHRLLLTQYCSTWIYVALLSAPLLLPMWRQAVTSHQRRAALTLVEFLKFPITPVSWLSGLLYPFSDAPPTRLEEVLPYLSHVGYLTVVLCVAGIYWTRRDRWERARQELFLPVTGLATLAIVLAMGYFALYLYRVPLYNRFRWPFKYLLFGNFFVVAAATLALDFLLEKLLAGRSYQRAVGALCLALCLGNALVLYVGFTPKPFRTFFERVPLEEPLRETLNGGKIFTLGFPWAAPRAAPSLGFDYATLWGLYHFAGYDPLVPETNSSLALRLEYFSTFEDEPELLPWERLRQWGVRWYVVCSATRRYDRTLQEHGLAVVHRDPERTVYRDAQARPLVFWEDGRADRVDYQIATNSIHLRTQSREAGRLCLNFLWAPRFQLETDGRPGMLERNLDGQMLVNVPAGEHAILVEYRDPEMRRGIQIAVLALALLAGHVLWMRRT